MTSHHPSCSRRLFLLGAATTFAGAVLAACGKSSESQELATTDIPVGSGIIVGTAIITQPVAGEYKAYSTTCPHQGYPITEVSGDTAICNRHNSKFSLTDGAVLAGPARDPLDALELSVADQTITIKN